MTVCIGHYLILYVAICTTYLSGSSVQHVLFHSMHQHPTISENNVFYFYYIIVIWIVMYDTTLCDKVYARLATDLWFSPGTPVSSTNTMDRHDRIEILLTVSLNTIFWTFVLMSISELVKHLRVMEDRISENVENLKVNPQAFRN